MAKYAAVAPAPNQKWEKLLGSNDWAGLLDPLDEDLREHLLRCGSFCHVSGESLVGYSQSLYNGECRYSPDDLLKNIFFEETAEFYVAVKEGYLYATITDNHPPNQKVTTFMGFVAVSNDDFYNKYGRREIYVVWRGTYYEREWNHNVDFNPVPFGPEPGVRIMKGWNDYYTTVGEKKPSAQDQLQTVIGNVLDKYKNQNPSIVCVGYSLGGALAVVSAFDIAISGLNKISDNDYIQVCAVALEGPRVGNQAFNDVLEKLKNTKVFRVNNIQDRVPTLPPRELGYVDTGKIMQIDSAEKSKFLKGDHSSHDLPVNLHILTGWGWKGEDTFDNDSEEVMRKLPLVNRWRGNLKDEYKVIEAWWQEENKGMVYGQKDNGIWQWHESAVPRTKK